MLILAGSALGQVTKVDIGQWFSSIKSIDSKLQLGTKINAEADEWLSELIKIREGANKEIKSTELEVAFIQKQLTALGEAKSETEQVQDEKPTGTKPEDAEQNSLTDPKVSEPQSGAKNKANINESDLATENKPSKPTTPAVQPTIGTSLSSTPSSSTLALIESQRAGLIENLERAQSYRKSLDLLQAQVGLLTDQIQQRLTSERLQTLLSHREGVFDKSYWSSLLIQSKAIFTVVTDEGSRAEQVKKLTSWKLMPLLGALVLLVFAVAGKWLTQRFKLSERLFIGTVEVLDEQVASLGSFLRWLSAFWGVLLLHKFLILGQSLYDFLSLLLSLPAVLALAVLILNRAQMRTIAPAYSRHLHDPLDKDEAVSSMLWLFRLVMVSGLFVVPVAFVLGYPNLARVTMSAYGTLAVLLGANLLGRGYMYRVIRAGVKNNTKQEVLSTDVQALETKAPLYICGEMLLMGLSLFFVLPFFGIGLGAIGQFLKDLWQGVQFGPVYVQISSIIGALVLFLVIWLTLRLIKSYLRHRVLPHTGWDEGVRDAILATFTYAGFALLFFATVSAAGVDMSRLAIVAGALSVGIGFGLQTIVSNVVSGLILLYERSIKPGDWVIVDGNVEGTIKQVKVRYTEIETFNRSTVMVPNSVMVGGSVTNLTHRDKMGRIQVDVGIAYAANPRDVMEILQHVVANFSGARKIPKPIVHFVGFGASSIDFTVKVYLTDIGAVNVARTNLAIDIYEALQAADIEIPFNQLDVHIRSDDLLPKATDPKESEVVEPGP
ncbi:MAG: mechanosensitive ion channel family protein [Alphaproteobacteria bacterium]